MSRFRKWSNGLKKPLNLQLLRLQASFDDIISRDPSAQLQSMRLML